jgi:plastocyanin
MAMSAKVTTLTIRVAGQWVMIALVLLGLAVTQQSLSAAATAPVIVVRMLDMPLAFQPNLIRIKAGDSVEWKNVGNEVHHATSDPSLAIKPAEVSNPPGAEPFDSGFLRPGETFTHVFTVLGEYKYTCVVHEAKGMIGTIVVVK